MKPSRILRTLNVLVLAALLAGCAAAPQAFLPQASAPTESSPPAASSTAAPADTPAAASLAAGPSAIPLVTATPDLRLPPEQWQDWPVAPAATGRAMEIYRQGLALGNDPRHFSKVGDCQSIKEVLMGIFDRPGFYQLTPEHAFLQSAIEQFAGSFNRDGMAVQGGFNAASVLSPLWANPDTCKAGENPLECEFRVHKPSFVIISLEVWWNGRTPERYEQYMRRIIEFAIAKGVVPILSTKADNVEGNHSINLATARLAFEYDLPLWNWWRAAQDLDNGGLDPTRPDGFHISNAAWTPRAFTALEALEFGLARGDRPIRRGVDTGGDAGGSRNRQQRCAQSGSSSSGNSGGHAYLPRAHAGQDADRWIGAGLLRAGAAQGRAAQLAGRVCVGSAERAEDPNGR